MKPKGHKWYHLAPKSRLISKPHREVEGVYSPKTGRWQRCACGIEAESLKEHVAKAEKLTRNFLKEMDNSKHISYWCRSQDHCCCTDHDWATCNCYCHKDDAEERHCSIRLERWRIARYLASKALIESNCPGGGEQQ